MPRITEIARDPYVGWVYDLRVVEDRSLVANGLVVHNCEEGVNPDAKFSVVSKAAPIYARIGPRVAKADAMRLSQFCADGSCPVNNTSALNEDWDEQTGGPVRPATPDVSMDPEAVDQQTDPRVADQAPQGQDWLAKARQRIRAGVVKQRTRRHGVPFPRGD